MTGVGGSRQRVLLVPVLVVTVAVTLLAGFHTVTVRQVCALFALAVCRDFAAFIRAGLRWPKCVRVPTATFCHLYLCC